VWSSDQKSQICAAAYQYDNGTDLANVTLYGVFWVFVHFDSDLHVVVGRGNYTLANAQAAMLPAVPNIVGDFSTLAAKVIIKNNGVNFTSISSAYERAFPSGGPFDHDDTTNKAGGTAGQYYHLTNAEHTELHEWLDNVVLGDTGNVDLESSVLTDLSITDILEMQLKTSTELTIAAGSVTRTQTFHTIDTQNDDAADDLDTIAGGTSGDLLIIRAAHADRTVTLKHNVNNLFLRGAADIDMDDATTLYFFQFDDGDSKWHDLGGGGGGGGASTWLDLTDTPAAFVASRFVAVNGAADALELVAGAACAFETTTVEVAGWEELEVIDGAAASYDFQNISQDYIDLQIVYRLRSDVAAGSDNINVALNNDAVDANYRFQQLYAAGAAASASTGDIRLLIEATGATAPAGSFAYGHANIQRYAEAELHIVDALTIHRYTAANIIEYWRGYQWETAAAITRITLTPVVGAFIAGSEAILYGLRKRDVVTAVTGQVVVTGDTVAKLATVTAIDATAEAETTLYTTPAGKTFVPDHVVIRVTAYTAGAKDQDAVASFGSNNPTYDDYLNTITYAVTAADVFLRDSVEDSWVVTHAAAQVFKLIIETASNADVETWAVDVFGYLV
jgi:hypothetical protein